MAFVSLATDFGATYSGVCVGVLARIAPSARVLVLTDELPRYQVVSAAMELRAALPYLPVGIHVGIVDPGVGTARRPIAVRCGRGDILIGPDNGVLAPAAGELGGIVEVRLLADRALSLPDPSHTFHGRDIFAPAAAHLANGVPLAEFGPEVVPVQPDIPVPVHDATALVATVLLVDRFGNLILAAHDPDLPIGRRLLVQGHPATRTDTYGDVPPGDLSVHVDSSGWLAVAVNQGDAAHELGLGPGDRVRIEPAPPPPVRVSPPSRG